MTTKPSATNVTKQGLRLSFISSTMITLIIVLAIGSILRFAGLADESYWVDEMTTVQLVSQGFSDFISIFQSGRPPAYMIAAYFWAQLFGVSEFATRSLTAITSILSLLALYLLGQKLFSKQVALLATLLMALSPFQLYHAQDIRYYSFLIFFAVLSFLFFVRMLESGKLIDTALYIITSILMCLSHSYGVFAVGAQTFFLGLHLFSYSRGMLIRSVGSQFLIGLAVLPMILAQMQNSSEGVMGWLAPPGLVELLRTPYRFIFGYDGWETILVVGLGISLLIVIALVNIFRKGRTSLPDLARNVWDDIVTISQTRTAIVLIGLWALVPLLAPFVLSYILGPMFLDRYASAATPAFALLLAFVLVGLRRLVPVPMSTAAFVIMLAFCLNYYYTHPQKEQWREVAALLENHKHGDDVIAQTIDIETVLDWYYPGDISICSLPEREVGADAAIRADLSQCQSGSERIWLIHRQPATLYTAYVAQNYLYSAANDLDILEKHSFFQVDVYLLAKSNN